MVILRQFIKWYRKFSSQRYIKSYTPILPQESPGLLSYFRFQSMLLTAKSKAQEHKCQATTFVAFPNTRNTKKITHSQHFLVVHLVVKILGTRLSWLIRSDDRNATSVSEPSAPEGDKLNVEVRLRVPRLASVEDIDPTVLSDPRTRMLFLPLLFKSLDIQMAIWTRYYHQWPWLNQYNFFLP